MCLSPQYDAQHLRGRQSSQGRMAGTKANRATEQEINPFTSKADLHHPAKHEGFEHY